MAKTIRGQRAGVQLHTPFGFYKNGTNPTADQEKYLKEAGYKFGADRAAVEEPAATAKPPTTTSTPFG